jgi:hypothetical protein
LIYANLSVVKVRKTGSVSWKSSGLPAHSTCPNYSPTAADFKSASKTGIAGMPAVPSEHPERSTAKSKDAHSELFDSTSFRSECLRSLAEKSGLG